MTTRIPYLEKLEADIQRAATKAVVLHPPRRRGAAVWGRRLGAVAAVLAVAVVIGSLAGTGGILPSERERDGKFNQVGTAVGGAGAGDSVLDERGDALGFEPGAMRSQPPPPPPPRPRRSPALPANRNPASTSRRSTATGRSR